eukprot:scaffold95567_cov54-Phaeocystis_antarctica.AAC.3
MAPTTYCAPARGATTRGSIVSTISPRGATWVGLGLGLGLGSGVGSGLGLGLGLGSRFSLGEGWG